MAQAALDNIQISERAEEEVPTSVDEDVPDSEEESSDREEDIDTNPTYINWPPPELVKDRWGPGSGGYGRDAKDRWFGISIGRCEVSKVDPSTFISTITFSHEKFAYRETLGRERKKNPIVGHIRQPGLAR
ncbi:hypothetical protein CJF30_00009547 [Rutstroemia sp. NJR-2017a BBW]|nr:hypothetical protein CJF30_00009547 [Rutstroemia sp. NJR-2017a BBW]